MVCVGRAKKTVALAKSVYSKISKAGRTGKTDIGLKMFQDITTCQDNRI